MRPYDHLRGEFLEGKYTRRQFVKMALALGISGGAISSFLAACAPTPAATEVAPAEPAEEEEPMPTEVPAEAPAGGEKVKLIYWTVLGNVDGIIMDALVKQFMDENPNIEIESLQGVEDFEAKLQSSVLTGVGPDVTLFRLHYVGPYASRNVILPFDSGQLSDQGVLKENFDQRVWDGTPFTKESSTPFHLIYG
jgi:ABC-type glycerol-3-phosphate transport system substrate-binding protein